jgi:hypothetical protein
MFVLSMDLQVAVGVEGGGARRTIEIGFRSRSAANDLSSVRVNGGGVEITVETVLIVEASIT